MSIENQNISSEIHSKCCVIIPTYNNNLTLAKVIEDVLVYSQNVIVVNDGSTDNTLEIIKSFPNIDFITYELNQGKGYAMRKAFKYAVSKGFEYAITIDSDGQHFAKDIPAFLQKIEEVPNSIIIGDRNMSQEGIPGKSSFGNRFSNFWYRFETGIKLPDTQSGYRLYPIKLMEKIRFFTKKYEFEIEVIVKAAWRGINVTAVPISVFYAPKETRISHFRPFKDFSRVSFLNTYLVILAILWYKPFGFLRKLKKEKIQEFFRVHLLNKDESNIKKSLSIALGIFMGIAPFWGFQLGLAILMAYVFRLNKLITAIAANISLPPMIPIIIYFSFKVGALIMNSTPALAEFSTTITLKSIKLNIYQYIFGSFGLAIICAVGFGTITFLLLLIFRKKQLQNINITE
ncbi:MAG: DUF2062 domain-containing protein [Bacteroidetes bacterium]|nr:DUF2062 domain-containing protein [Bacteroidota bacterium]